MQKRLIALLAAALLTASGICAAAAEDGETTILLSDSGVQVNGAAASTDPEAAVYTGAEIIYYHDGTDETYGEGTESEQHSAEEAAAHTVVTITQPGTYRISGTLSRGQIFVDLGETAKTDPEAVVTLILDNAHITCTVAPAVFFYRVYECDQAWVAYDEGEAESYDASGAADTSAAGANVVLAAGSENTAAGSYVARIYKEGTTKKLHKYDGAFYSRMSMNLSGDGGDDSGSLTIIAENEGLDSELHLTINGGSIYIESQNDGINTNEDDVSVTTINGGTLTISAGLGDEGDGIDSNGYLTINGGTIWSMSNEQSPDGGIDASREITINGGSVYAFGIRNDTVSDQSQQALMELSFASVLPAGTEIRITGSAGYQKTAFSLERACQSITLSLDTGSNSFARGETYYVYVNGVQQQYTGNGGGMPGGPGGFPPDGTEPPEDAQGGRPGGGPGFGPGQDGEPPEGMMPPDGELPSDGLTRPEDREPHQGLGGRPGSFMPGQADGEGSAAFTLTDTVSSFANIRDWTETLPFTDVALDNSARAAIQAIYEAGIMTGTGENQFSPEETVTRAQAVVVLARLAGAEPQAYEGFSDVDPDAWYGGYVGWAAENGIVLGDGQGHFLPDAAVTGADMLQMTNRYVQSAGLSYTAPADAGADLPLTRAGLAVLLAELLPD